MSQTAVSDAAEARARLAACADQVHALGVMRLALFGSVLRGEPLPASEVDLLVEFAPGAKSFDRFMALADLLEALFGRRVELVTPDALSPFIGSRIVLEARDVLRAAWLPQHILYEADFLIREASGVTAEEFDANETLLRAFVRSLEVIGEAAKKLPADFRAQHSDVEWRNGMRDRLIHDYFGVDYELVWDVLTSRIPELLQQIASILEL